MTKLRLLLLIVFILFNLIYVRSQKFDALPFGDIKPDGWIYNQILRDITSGNSSYLEHMRLLGAPVNLNEKRGYGEFEGNFTDAIIRNAVLTGYEPWLERAKAIADFLLASQDSYGYIGRKRPESFKELAGNEIELWSQCCFLRAFLAYYEYSKDKKYLDAIERSVNLMIKTFGDGENRYFIGETSMEGGARAHGLMYVDVLEKLYQLTGNKKYVDFAFRLYEDYSIAVNLKNVDSQKSYLLDAYVPFFHHAPHVAEHARVVFWLSTMTDDPEYKKIAEHDVAKFRTALSPSGGLITDDKLLEAVGGKNGSPDLRYEYCSLTESLISFESAFQKTGRPELAEIVENIVFNAAQAARFPDGKACAYCSKDNQMEAKGTPDNHTFRYQYAACHRIACCVFNLNRVMPYYVSGMWMKTGDDKSLVAAFYGPSVLNTKISGTNVEIIQQTMFPFENNMSFKINPEKNKSFNIYFRIPGWSVKTTVEAPGAKQIIRNGYVILNKKWEKGDRVYISFTPKIRVETAFNNEFYVKRGTLLYALPLPEKLIPTKMWEGTSFANYDVELSAAEDEKKFNEYRLPKKNNILAYTDTTLFVYRKTPGASGSYPFDHPYGEIQTTFLYRGAPVKETMVPVGSALLRRVTFSD